MRKNLVWPLAILVAVGVSACTSGNSAIIPPSSSANLNANTLQFAVGTANINGSTGLNTVVTYRQPNGLSGALADYPVIVGPNSFVVPSVTSAGADAGTNSISGDIPPAGSTHTFGTSGGAFGYGFAPANTSTTGGANFSLYSLPLYSIGTKVVWRAGPPAWPNVRDGTFPPGFQGYTMGFVDFSATPVTGTYTLNLRVPTSPSTIATFSTTATLSTTTPLGVMPVLTFKPDGLGGGTFTYGALPAGVTEAFVVVLNRDGKCYSASGNTSWFTVPLTGSGTATLPDTIGPTLNGAPTQTLCTAANSAAFNAANGTTGGDRFYFYAVGANYPLFESAYPQSTVPNPTITGSNGQADITTTARQSGQYP